VKRKYIASVLFDFFVADFDSHFWYRYNTFESAEFNKVKELLITMGDCVLDAGAHHGIFALPVSKLIGPQGKVIAIEAHPINVKVLRENVEMNVKNNGFSDNIEIVHAAVGASNSEDTWLT
jgi:predicted RNA methylase